MANFFTFSGRIRSTEYLVTPLIISFISGVIFSIFLLSLFTDMATLLSGAILFVSGAILFVCGAIIFVIVSFLALFWVAIASGPEDYHDRKIEVFTH